MSQPLAERMRPNTLDEYIGQRHLVGKGAVLRNMIEARRITSFILWGPPGVGKTTLAQIVANTLQLPFYTLSAVTSGVKDVREVIDKARGGRFFNEGNPILFIDEIHRFSKSQQDSLLGAVEKGVVTLIGATTENPSFEVIRPLLSRCQLYVLKPLGDDDQCTYTGASAIVSPYGKVMAGGGAEEGWTSAELVIEKLDKFRKTFPVLDDKDEFCIIEKSL